MKRWNPSLRPFALLAALAAFSLPARADTLSCDFPTGTSFGISTGKNAAGEDLRWTFFAYRADVSTSVSIQARTSDQTIVKVGSATSPVGATATVRMAKETTRVDGDDTAEFFLIAVKPGEADITLSIPSDAATAPITFHVVVTGDDMSNKITFEPASPTFAEGGTVRFTVHLGSAPAAAKTLTLTLTGDDDHPEEHVTVNTTTMTVRIEADSTVSSQYRINGLDGDYGFTITAVDPDGDFTAGMLQGNITNKPPTVTASTDSKNPTILSTDGFGVAILKNRAARFTPGLLGADDVNPDKPLIYKWSFAQGDPSDDPDKVWTNTWQSATAEDASIPVYCDVSDGDDTVRCYFAVKVADSVDLVTNVKSPLTGLNRKGGVAQKTTFEVLSPPNTAWTAISEFGGKAEVEPLATVRLRALLENGSYPFGWFSKDDNDKIQDPALRVPNDALEAWIKMPEEGSVAVTYLASYPYYTQTDKGAVSNTVLTDLFGDFDADGLSDTWEDIWLQVGMDVSVVEPTDVTALPVGQNAGDYGTTGNLDLDWLPTSLYQPAPDGNRKIGWPCEDPANPGVTNRYRVYKYPLDFSTGKESYNKSAVENAPQFHNFIEYRGLAEDRSGGDGEDPEMFVYYAPEVVEQDDRYGDRGNCSGTDPQKLDTDGDGFSDGWEFYFWTTIKYRVNPQNWRAWDPTYSLYSTASASAGIPILWTDEPVDFTFTIDPTEGILIDPAVDSHKTTYEVDNDVIKANNLIMPVKPGSVTIELDGTQFKLWTIQGRMTKEGYDALFYQKWGDADKDGVVDTPAFDDDGNPVPSQLAGAWVDCLSGHMHVPGWDVLTKLEDANVEGIDENTTATISYVRFNGIFTQTHLLSRFDPMNWTVTDMGRMSDLVKSLGLDAGKWDPDSDLDGDGVLDIEEYYLGTDPLHWDTDRDGMPDGWEVQRGLNPISPRNGDGTGPGDNPDEDYMAVSTGVKGEPYAGTYTHIYSYLADQANRRYWNGLSYVGFVPGKAATGGTPFSNLQEFLVSLYGFQTAFWWDAWRLPIGYEPRYTDDMGISKYALGIYPVDWPDTTSNPCDNDTNKDGIPDGWSLYVGYNPIDGVCVTPLSFPPESDPDGDGFTLRQEFSCAEAERLWPETRTVYIGPNASNTETATTTVDESGNTNTVYATTGEGTMVTIRAMPHAFPAWTSKKLSTDPWNGDTDGDGLGDAQEYTDEEDRNGDGIELANFNPCSADTDLDWLPDGWELFMGTYTTNQTPGVSKTDPYGPFGDPDGDGLPNYQEYLTAANYAWRYDKWYSLDNQKIWIPQKRPELGDLDNKYDVLGGDWPYDPGLFPDLGPVVKAHQYRPMDFFAVPESAGWITEGLVALQTIEKRWKVTEADSPSIHYETVAAMFQRLTEIVMNGFPNEPMKPSKFLDDTQPSVDPIYNSDMVDIPGKKYFQHHTPEEHWAIVHAYEGILGYLYSYAQRPYEWDTAALHNTPSGVPWTYIPLNDNSTAIGFPGTRPKELDSDHDNMPDYWEIYHGLNPTYGGCIAISDKAGSEANTDWDGTDNWVMGNDPNFVLNMHFIPPIIPVCRFSHSWYDADGVEHTFGDGESTAFGGQMERAHYDLVLRPWLAGDPSADCDHDGVNNQEESYSVFANDLLHNTDPSPYWMTDITQTYGAFGQKASHVNLYYTSLGFGDDTADYWWWEEPYTGNAACNAPPTYLWDFEINEGYDSDNDNVSDREEVTDASTRGKTDPQDLDSPISRKAMYFDGYAACRTQRPFFHDQYALTSFTVEFWVRPQELPAPGKIASLVQRPVMMPVDTVSGSKAWDIRHTFYLYLDELGRVCAEVDNDGIEQPANRAVVASGGRLVPGVWTHVALVMDSRRDTLTLYLNGEQAGYVATSLKPCTGVIMDSSYQNWTTSDGAENGIGTASTTTVNFQYSPAPIVFGAFDKTPWSVIGLNPDATFDENRFFKGWIDEVRIWDRCRSQTEILNNMTKRFKKADFEGINLARFKWDMENLYQTNSEDDFPLKLLYLYNFDNLPDVIPSATRDPTLVFPTDTDATPAGWPEIAATRPIPYVPWWFATKNRSTVYSSDYSYVPFVENVVSHLPQRPPRGVKELMPVFDAEWNLAGYRYRLSADWGEELDADIVAGAQVIGDVAYQYEENGGEALIAPNRIKNTMDAYGDTYTTGVSSGEEVSPWNFGGILDPYGVYEGVPLHSDMVPLLDAVADMDVPMWDGKGAGWDQSAIDSDGDGMPDWWEIAHGLDPNDGSGSSGAYGDADNDGLDNYSEYLAGTDPFAFDTDSDGYSDYYSRPDGRSLTYGEMYDDGDGMDNAWEIENGLDPNRYDATDDADGDGWTNWEEYMAGADPRSTVSYPQPDFSVTFDYDGDQDTAELTVLTYGERTGGVEMGGAYDGRYTLAPNIHYARRVLGSDGRGRIGGNEYNVNFFELGHVASATLSFERSVNGTNTTVSLPLQRWNDEFGMFVSDLTGTVGLAYESGTVFCSDDYKGVSFTLAVTIDGYTFPFTAERMLRSANSRLVGGYNRFLGFADVNKNNQFDAGEPMGISVPRPTLVGWDSVHTEIPLTDELWDFPRLSWTAATNAGVRGYNVVFQWISKTYAKERMIWAAYGDTNANGMDDALEREIAAALSAAGRNEEYVQFTNDLVRLVDLYDATNAVTGLTWGEEFDDGDGMPASWEASHTLDPYHYDGHLDDDTDGWTNYKEWLAQTYPGHGRSFPQPVFEILVDYSGEGGAVTNANLWFQTYSARRNRTYVDANGDAGIEMGGWFDGVYTTDANYASVPDAQGTGTQDDFASASDGASYFMADGVFGEDGKLTVQNLEFEVSYLPITFVKPSSMIGTSIQLFDPDNDYAVVAQGTFGTEVYGEYDASDDYTTGEGAITLQDLNPEVGIFQLQSIWGFAVTNLYSGEIYGQDSRTGVWGFGYEGMIEADVNGKYKGLILFQYDTGALLTYGEYTKPGKRYAYRIVKAGGIQTGGYKFPAKVGGWYRLDEDALPVSMWYRADRVNHDHMVEGPNRIFAWSDVNGNKRFDMGEPAGLSLYNSFVAGQDSVATTVPLTDELWGYPRLSWGAAVESETAGAIFRSWSESGASVEYDVRFSYDRVPTGYGDGSDAKRWGDSDGDGLEDWIETDAYAGTDPNSTNGVPNDYYAIDPATRLFWGELYDDGDGMPTEWELRYAGLDPQRYDAADDLDDDGWSNYAEFMAGTSPNDSDSFPEPTLDVTFRYTGSVNGSSVLKVQSYGELLHGRYPGSNGSATVNMAGSGDALYTSSTKLVGTFGMPYYSNGEVHYYIAMAMGVTFDVSATEAPGIRSATLSFYRDGELCTYEMQEFNEEYGYFVDDDTDHIFFEYATGYMLSRSGETLTDDDPLRGRWYTFEYTPSAKSYPFTVRGMTRIKEGYHLVEGRNRFLGFMDLNSDGTWDAGEPMGLSPEGAVLAGWDTASAEIPLTDSLWDYPRISWESEASAAGDPADGAWYVTFAWDRGVSSQGGVSSYSSITGDSDGDGLEDWAEPLVPGADPNGATNDYYRVDDATGLFYGEIHDDGDGIPTAWETRYGLDPYRFDAQLDLDDDGWSNWSEFMGGTDPTNPDDYPEPDFDVTFRYTGVVDGASTLKVLTYGSNVHGLYPGSPAAGSGPAASVIAGGRVDGTYTPINTAVGIWNDNGTITALDTEWGTSYIGQKNITEATIYVYLDGEEVQYLATPFPVNDAYAYFVNDDKARIFIEWKTGLVLTQFFDQGTHSVHPTTENVNNPYSTPYRIVFTSVGEEFPMSIGNLARDKSNGPGHMVEGPNRFLGLMDLDGNGTWNFGEPMGLSLGGATPVGWETVSAEIPLTDSVWGFPRVAWEAAPFENPIYYVEFTWVRGGKDEETEAAGTSYFGTTGDWDNDGLEDWMEALVPGADPNSTNGVPNEYYSIDPASKFLWGELLDDGDGMPTAWEMKYGLDPYRYDASGDVDDDGWSNYSEFMAGTDPTNASSYPHPKLAATFYYHGAQTDLACLGVYTYGQKTKGTTWPWGGDYDGRYTSTKGFSDGVYLGSDGTVTLDEWSDAGAGGTFAVNNLAHGLIESASINVYVEGAEGAMETRTFQMQQINPGMGVFTQDEMGWILIEIESGRVLSTGDYVGKIADVHTTVKTYTFPVTFKGLIRNPEGNHTHMVEGPNRFFGWMDLDGNETYDQGEPMGLSLYNPSLVGWDSTSMEIPLTDSLWDYPRVSWHDFTPSNFVPKLYTVRFFSQGESTSGSTTNQNSNQNTPVGIYGDLDGDGLDTWMEAKILPYGNPNKRDPDYNPANWQTNPDDDQNGRLQYDWVDRAAVVTKTGWPAGKLTFGELLDDTDGMPAEWESLFGLNPNLFDADSDLDNDGWSNYAEFLANTDPSDPDDYPEPQFDVTFRYDGEVDGSAKLKVASYSERRQGTHFVETAPDTIYMGGIHDGLYTTHARSAGIFNDLGEGAIDEETYGTSSFGGEHVGSATLTLKYFPGEDTTAETVSYDLQPSADDRFGVFVDDGEARILLEYETGIVYTRFTYQVTVKETNGTETVTTYTDFDKSKFGHYRDEHYTVEYTSSTTHYPFTVRGLQAVGAGDEAYASHDHMVEGWNRFLGWMDLNDDNTWNPGEPMGLSLYDATLVGWDSVATEIPLTDELFGFPRLTWPTDPAQWVDAAQTNKWGTHYTVWIWNSSGELAVPDAGIRVEAPRNFVHEGDYIEAGCRGLAFASDNDVFSYTVMANDGEFEKLVASGTFRQIASSDIPSAGSRRAMSALYPTNNAVLHGPLVELRWAMDWRTEGVDVTVKKGSTTVISEYVPFPVRHGRITDDDYYYSYIPQLKDGRSIVALGAGTYTWTVKEHLNLSGYTKKTASGSFKIEAPAASTRDVASISGNIHYYGRLANANGVFEAGKVKILVYRVSDRASTSLCFSGNPVAKVVRNGAGPFSVDGLGPGAYGLVAFVDADNDDVPDVGETQGMAFIGGSADPVQLPSWFKDPIRISVKDGAAVSATDVHIVLRDRDVNGDGVPEIFSGDLAQYAANAVVTVPATKADNWVTTAVFDKNFKPWNNRVTRSKSTTSTSGKKGERSYLAEFYVEAPRKFLHEGDLARMGQYGFDLGEFHAAEVSWEVVATDDYHYETNSQSSTFFVDAGSDETRSIPRPRWPTQMTVVHGSTVKFEWEMDPRNAGVEFKLERLDRATLAPVETLIDRTVPFPVMHWDESVKCYYYTAVPQMEDGLQFVSLPDGVYRWTVTERPNTTIVTARKFSETFQVLNAENTRTTGSIEGEIRYYGRAMVDAANNPTDEWQSDLRIRAYRTSDAASSSASVGGLLVAESVQSTNGAFRLEGLAAGTYNVHAFVDSNGNGVADEWETQGIGILGGNASPVVISAAAPPIVVTNGASVIDVKVVLHDRDTDGDLLPDVWEYGYGNGHSLTNWTGYNTAASNDYVKLTWSEGEDCLLDWIWKATNVYVRTFVPETAGLRVRIDEPRTFLHEGDLLAPYELKDRSSDAADVPENRKYRLWKLATDAITGVQTWEPMDKPYYGFELGAYTNIDVKWTAQASDGVGYMTLAESAFRVIAATDDAYDPAIARYPVQNEIVRTSVVQFEWKMDERTAGVDFRLWKTSGPEDEGGDLVADFTIPLPVRHWDADERCYYWTARPQQEDGLRFLDLPDGYYRYEIKTRPRTTVGGSRTIRERFRMAKGGESRVTGSISGTIRYFGRAMDTNSVPPTWPADLHLQARRVGSSSASSASVGGEIASDEVLSTNGAFRIEGLKAGTYTVFAFVDSNTNGVADAWETQGFGVFGGTASPVVVPGSAPPIVVTNGAAVSNVNVVLHDRDTDDDNLPDVWEWKNYGSLAAAWAGHEPGERPYAATDRLWSEGEGVLTDWSWPIDWTQVIRRAAATVVKEALRVRVEAPRTFLHEGDLLAPYILRDASPDATDEPANRLYRLWLGREVDGVRTWIPQTEPYRGFDLGSHSNIVVSWTVEAVDGAGAAEVATGSFPVRAEVGEARMPATPRYPVQNEKVRTSAVEFQWTMDECNAGVVFDVWKVSGADGAEDDLDAVRVLADRVVALPVRHWDAAKRCYYWTARPQQADGTEFVPFEDGFYFYRITTRPQTDLVAPETIEGRFQMRKGEPSPTTASIEGVIRYFGRSMATNELGEATWGDAGLHLQAWKVASTASSSASAGGIVWSDEIRSTNGAFRIDGLPAGTYAITAFVDSNGNGLADDWETQGFGVFGGSASPVVNASTAYPIIVTNGQAVSGVNVLLHDRDTDSDLLPDIWEWTTYTNLSLHNGYEAGPSNAYVSLEWSETNGLADWIWPLEFGAGISATVKRTFTIHVDGPRTFLHEGDYLRNGLYGIDLGGGTNVLVEWTATANNGLEAVDVGTGMFYLCSGGDESRREMKAVYPVQSVPVYESDVELKWEMDWRNAGVVIGVTNVETGVGFSKVVPFPYRHGRITARDYWFSARPQLESGDRFELLPPGEYEYTITEMPNSAAVTPQVVRERFRLVPSEGKIGVGAIKGRVRYYGRLLDGGSFDAPIVVQAWPVSDRARTALNFSGNPVAAWTNATPGDFELLGLPPGAYGIHAFVDFNTNGVADAWETQGYGFLGGDFNPVQVASQMPAIVLTNDYVNLNGAYVAGKENNTLTGYTGGSSDIGLVTSVTNVNIVLRDPDLDSDRLPDAWEWREFGDFATSGYDHFLVDADVLPDGLRLLEYVESTGAQWIDTGVLAGPRTRSETDMAVMAWGDGVQISGSGSNRHAFGKGWSGSITNGGNAAKLYFGLGSQNYASSVGLATLTGVRHVYWVDAVQAKAGLDGREFSLTSTGDIETNLFSAALLAQRMGTNETNVRGQMAARLYGCRYYEEGYLVRDFIPVLDEVGSAGLFDCVSGQIFYSATATPLVAGPEHVPTDSDPARWQAYAQLPPNLPADPSDYVFATVVDAVMGTTNRWGFVKEEITVTSNASIQVKAPRTFLHEGDLVRAGIAGFNLGTYTNLAVNYFVTSYGEGMPVSSRRSDAISTEGGVGSIYISSDVSSSRKPLVALYPTQATKIFGNVVEFEWQMDWHNAGVEFSLTNLTTGGPAFFDREIIPFPIRHGRLDNLGHYYTATPQTLDGKRFVSLPDGLYEYTITERPMTDLVAPKSVTERFQLDNSGETRGLYDVSGIIRYYGKVMQRRTVPIVGGDQAPAPDRTRYELFVDPADVAPGSMGVLLVRGAKGDAVPPETPNNWSGVDAGSDDWAEEFFNDSAANGVLYASSTTNSAAWSGTIDYGTGRIALNFTRAPDAALSFRVVKKVFPTNLVLQAYRLSDDATTCVSASGTPVYQEIRNTKGGFTITNLAGGKYSIRAFIDSNGSGYADEWETQGLAVTTGTVSPNIDPDAAPIEVRDNVTGLMIVLHDRDTDNDLLPDAWEWWKTGGSLLTSGYDLSEVGGLFWYQEYADGILDSDPRTPDTDLDGLTDAMEILVTKTDTHLRDTDGDGIGDLEEFLSGSDPLSADEAIPYTVPSLGFDANGTPFVEISYPALRPGVTLTYELQRKLSLSDGTWTTVGELPVSNNGGTVLYGQSDGVNAHLSEPGTAVLRPEDQEGADAVDLAVGFYRIKVFADYGEMRENADGTCSYWTWVQTGPNSFEYKEAARGKGKLVRDADGNWSFVSDATGRKGVLIRGEDGTWTFQE